MAYHDQPPGSRWHRGRQLLLVQCWCQHDYVWVDSEDVAVGVTYPCWRGACGPPRD